MAASPASRAAPPSLNLASLRRTASRIRDDLDPIVARDGPKELVPDDVLWIHSVLLALQEHAVPLPVIRASRIHLAVAEICGKATRWPTRLVNEADRAMEHLKKKYGAVVALGGPLFEKGARLHGVCLPQDLTRDALMRRFASQSPDFVDNSRAHTNGGPLDAHWEAGQWWINGMFAFRDGIIDERCTDGGICYNEHGAYAIVMTGSDEQSAGVPGVFTYRCGEADRGRFRLTAANRYSKHLIRVLRSHLLSSGWAPRVGLRYDRLHRISGWTCRPVESMQGNEAHIRLQYDVHFIRQDKEPMTRVLRHPIAEEVDDYNQYKASCLRQRDREHRGAEILALQFKQTGPQYRAYSDSFPHQLSLFSCQTTPSSSKLPSREDSGRSDRDNTRFRPLSALVPPIQGARSRSQDPAKQIRSTMTAPFTVIAKRSSNDRPRHRSSDTFDGSAEEDAPPDPSPTTTHPPNDSFTPQDPSTGTQSTSWDSPLEARSLFTPVDWDPAPFPAYPSPHHGGTSLVDPLMVIKDPEGARRRGAFEAARGKRAVPENAGEFLRAIEGVWDEVCKAEYVDSVAVRGG